MRRSGWGILVAIFAAASLAGSTEAGTSTPACTTGANGSLTPVLSSFAVNQGLASYTSLAAGFSGRLVRGKETLVRPYFVLPSSCTGSITLTGATLTATISGVARTYSPLTGTGAGSVPGAVAAASTVDPLFDIPAADLAPGDGSSTFSVSWSLRLSFTQNRASTVLNATYSGAPITATTFERKTNALRILVVPMGDPTQAFASQFPSAAQTDIQNAMTTLDRIYPVESGTGDLSSSTGGVRYTIDLAAMVDLKSIANAYNPTSGRFCGSQTNFDAIKGQLSQFLQTWNAQNPSAAADRVVGAVYGGTNTSANPGISDGGSSGCAEGMAGISSQVAWVRAIDDVTGRTPAYSWTGAIMAMEVAHTFGLAPAPRASTTSAYHSANIAADVVTPTGKAYNISSRTYVANNHSVMRFDTSTSPDDNTDTLLEQQDYNDLLCILSPGAATNPECATTGIAGTSTGVAAGSMLYGSGTTDGTAANTSVVETFYNTGTQPLGQCTGSPLHVVQLNAGVVAAENAICLRLQTSDHSGSGPAKVNAGVGVFSFAVPAPAGGAAGTVELTYNGTAIYQRDRQASPPAVGAVTATRDLGPLTVTAPTIPPTPDILILADTTGSMGAALQSVQAALTADGGIIKTVLATRSNAEFGAANYRDVFADPTTASVLNQALTADSSSVQAAVNNWQPAGGGDPSEDQLNALHQIATDSYANGEIQTPIGWRTGSTRIVVWFGDSNGHDPSNGYSLDAVITALQNAKIHVVAVPVGGTTGNGLESPVNGVDQPKAIVDATGGKLQPLTDAAAVANAILAGLHDLPVTLGQSTSCDDNDHLSLSLGSRAPAENPIASGAPVTYSDVVATIKTGAAPGKHTCTVSFTVNGNPDDSLTKTYEIDVSPQVSTVNVTATSPTAGNLRVDLVYVCNGVQYPVAVGLVPADVSGNVASFSTHFDSTLACGDSGGQLVAYAADGVDRSGTSPAAPPTGAPGAKAPTAAIYVPFAGPFAPGATVAYSGTGKSPQTGELPGTALSWSLKDGSGTTIGTFGGKTGTFVAPTTEGVYTMTLTATDSAGNGSDTHTILVAAPPVLTITDTPSGPISSTSPVAVTVAASDAASGLAAVACSVDGAAVGIPAPTGSPGAAYNAQVSIAGSGPHTTQCVATANDGLTSSAADQVAIAYVFNGFLPPVNNGVTNTGKAGRTYPLKWQLKDVVSGNFFSSLAIVLAVQQRVVSCANLSPQTDPLEATATGGTVLRYDTSANQYIYNWQSPSSAGCYEIDVSTDDGVMHTAFFKLS